MKDKKLGKGLEFLLGGGPIVGGVAAPHTETTAVTSGTARATTSTDAAVSIAAAPRPARTLLDIPVADIHPGRNQPRKTFVAETLDSLAQSIRTEGIVQPVIVRRVGDRYELISGERRWRAGQKAGVSTIPCLVIEADDNRALQIALIENIQRSDLNPIEMGSALVGLIQRFSCTQELIAERLGIDRSSIANYIRLLDLPVEIKESVSRGTISMGHARALLGVENEREIKYLAKRVESERMSVRKLENIIRLGRGKPYKKSQCVRDPLSDDIEEKLREFFGTTVSVESRNGSWRISIYYYDDKKLSEMLEKIGITI